MQDDGKSRDSNPASKATGHIPSFYTPGEGGRGRGRRLEGESLEEKVQLILGVWRRENGSSNDSPTQPSSSKVSMESSSDKTIWTVAGVKVPKKDAISGLPVEQFAAVAKTLCGFPSFFAAPLFRRVKSQFGGCRQHDEFK